MEQIQAVQRMQDYIREHFCDEEFDIEKVCAAAGYSRRHADRIFAEHIGMTLQEYTNAVCLTQSSVDLLDTKQNILDIALNSHFQSHEGFTRSFRKRFGVTPSEYRNTRIPIPRFVQHPISHYYALLHDKEETTMSNETSLCMITAKERPRRKLIYLPSRNASDYLSYCEEIGCDWEGVLNSIPEKFDTAALLELPAFLVKEGFSKTAAGIEVPLDFDKPLPAGYQTAELPGCIMLYFQTEPFENDMDFGKAIETAYAAVSKYNPALYGYQPASSMAPLFNLGADPATGARLAIPVLPINGAGSGSV